MGFNSMFASLSGEGENSDRIMTKNGARIKWMTGKQPIVFTILPALDPTNPDKRTSYLPSIIPTEGGDSLSEWGNYAWVTRGIGHGESYKDLASVVMLKMNRNDDTVCPLSMVYATIKANPEWQYLTDDGKFGDPNRKRAVLPLPRLMMFANVYVKGEEEKGAQIGIFSNALAKKIMGKDGLVWQRDPRATDEQIAQNYLSAYANGDITDPNNAPAFCVEKGHDKGEMSAYEFRYALDAQRRIIHIPASQDVMATRYDITNKEEYLNILTPDQTVQLLIRELNGRNPSTGFHEYALLREALGSMFQIPEPPAAPAATHTIQGADIQPAQPAPETASIPLSAQAPAQTTYPVHNEPVASVPTNAYQQPGVSAEANTALAAAVKAGAAVPSAPAPAPAPAPAAQTRVVGDAVPKFDKAAFLARMAAKGGQQ